MGLLRAPVMPKQASATWPKSMFLTPAVAEHHKPQNTHRKKSGKKATRGQPPNSQLPPVTAAHNSPFCARCDLRPKAPKANKKNRTCTAGFEAATANMRIYEYPPAAAPLHVGSSWPEHKAGTFGTFLYIKDFCGYDSTYAELPICARFKAKRCPWGAKQHASAATFRSQYSCAIGALGLGLQVDGRKSAKTHAVAKW